MGMRSPNVVVLVAGESGTGAGVLDGGIDGLL